VVENDPDNPTPWSFARQALHAAEITFTHPVSLDPMTIKAPLPPDFEKLLSLVRKSSVGLV
jgi:23S rRNA pseudouridine1911/1915/1917 synthase